MSDGYREIQLTGKQLVFLFMSVVVVAVVIFLLGVSVGRSVPGDAAVVAGNAGMMDAEGTDLTSGPDVGQPDDLTYDEELQDGPSVSAAPPTASPEPEVVPEPEASSEPVEPPDPPAPAPAASETPASAPPAAAEAPPTGDGWFVQLGAFGSRENADALVARLRDGGYAAFITSVGSLHRVRVGPYADRAEADRVAARLGQQEGTSPSVIR